MVLFLASIMGVASVALLYFCVVYPRSEPVLTVDETVGAVFSHGPGGLLKRANPEATDILLTILSDVSLQQYHSSAAICLGYTATNDHVDRLRAEIVQRVQTTTSSEQRWVGINLMNSLGIMATRGNEYAADLLKEMARERYWREINACWYPPGVKTMTTSEYLYAQCAVISYALSDRNDVDVIVNAALQEIEDEALRNALASGMRQAVVNARRERMKMENEPVVVKGDLGRLLLQMWNRNVSEPRPTNMRIEFLGKRASMQE